ncbi:MAG TPA: hypothetical protein VGQ20_11910 [Acidimicrobiales bacterium]|nr:hypothetical protein [Acidimicrobiales bacterium]
MRVMRRSGAIAGFVALVAVTVVAACSDSSATGDDDGALYAAVIRRVAAGQATELPSIVFVETLPGTKISLADQTSIVKALDDATDVRFIDDPDEAVDDAQPQAPVRREGVLVRVGSAERDDGTAQVKAMRYVDLRNEQSICVRVRLAGRDWEIISADRC